MAFQPSKMIGLIWHHPIVSLVVLLLFTPPLFPIVVYFSPLLISTALFVLAMISMGSDHDDSSNYSSNDLPFKRVWIEEFNLEGPYVDGERVPKRLKASSKDDSWFDKVKNWEGTGRAWVESVLSQEARKGIYSDDSAALREESIPLLEKAREFFSEDIRKRSREADTEPKSSSRPIDGSKSVVNAEDPAPGLSVEKSESLNHAAHVDPGFKGKSSTEITPEIESEDGLIEISSAKIPPSPLFRSKSLPKEDAAANVAADVLNAAASVTEAPLGTVDSVPPVESTDSEDGKKTALSLASADEKISVLPEVEHEPANHQDSSNVAESAIPNDVPVAKEKNFISKVTAQIPSGDIQSEIKPAVNSGVSSKIFEDRNVGVEVHTNVTTEEASGKSGAQPTEAKSAGELPAPLRQEQAPYGLGTPSAAVALSEKLKVPLADIMSLLAGDDKESTPNEEVSGVKASTSSETSSQEEDWSSSDVESPAPATAVQVPS